jgi:hypothetical protein
MKRRKLRVGNLEDTKPQNLTTDIAPILDKCQAYLFFAPCFHANEPHSVLLPRQKRSAPITGNASTTTNRAEADNVK